MDDFEKELKAGFLEEASQLLADTEQCFLSLEANSKDASILEKIFRLAHNLKGSAKAVGFEDLSRFTHQFESLLLKMKKGEIEIGPDSVDLLLRCTDHVRMMLEGLKVDFEAHFDSSALFAEIEGVLNGQAPAREDAPPAASLFPADDPVVPELALVEVAEGPSNIIPIAASPAAPVVASEVKASGTASEDSIRVSFSRLERLLNFVGELVILQKMLREQTALAQSPTVRKTVDQLGKVTKEVQDISMGLRMVPLKQTFLKMQRIVRDTGRALDKKLNLELVGEDTEVDKTLLEKLGDPLVHMVRNAADHGIESAEKRLAAGKPELGTIRLSAFHRGGNLVIEIRDDGGGLDAAKLKAKAVEKGILTAGAQLTDREAYQLIFASGFSTKSEVTDVSGRGVGMDVVRTNIMQLQGEIQIETELGKGSCFRVILPLTLAIIDAMVVRCMKDTYVIPLSHVHESLRLHAGDIRSSTPLGDVLFLRGENIPLYRLNQVLGLSAEKSDGIAIVIRTQEAPFAVVVDDIIGQQQIVIKALGQELRTVKGFSGSAILGNGRPALILELHDLISRGKALASKNIQKGVATL